MEEEGVRTKLKVTKVAEIVGRICNQDGEIKLVI